jgi:hypothetical protein
MRSFLRPAIAALSAGCLVTFASAGGVLAQAAKPVPAAPAPAPATAPIAPPALKQIALTDKQIENVLAAQKDLDEVTSKIPDNAMDKPDPKIVAQLDAVSKKYGFVDYADYNAVVDNISLVLGGFDPKTKTYVGPDAVVKGQIDAVNADKKMPAKEKKEALGELNDALKNPPPAVANKGNIDLVGKYYDKLVAAMQEE